MLHLAKKAGVLPEGTSGCPVMRLEKDGKYHLVGLHFSGDDDDKDGKARALLWENGIASYIKEVARIIIDIETYLADKSQAAKLPDRRKGSLMAQAEDAKKRLESSAKKNRLTIYLTDGEIIKGLQ